MKNFAARLLVGFFLLVPVAAQAQSSGTVVADCAVGPGQAYTPGANRVPTINTIGQNCITGTISASLSGFAPATTGTPITATTGGATGSLPAGTVVAVFNTGTTNTAYCKLGASATTSDIAIPPSGWFAYTVGAATQLTCITSTSTTTVNMVGGSGLPTGAGGGGGGGSSSITSWAGGTLGAMATYGTSPGAVLVPGVNAYVTNTIAGVGNNVDDVTPAAAPAAAPVAAYNYVYDGTNWDRQRAAVLNPCETVAQSYAPISITTATTTRIVTPSASNKTYICGLILVTAAANNVGIVEGTGGTCGSGTAGVIGGTTASNGPNYSANGGMVLQAGKVSHAQTAGTNVDLCLITSAATPLAGGIKYVQAP